jgi:hypothetical protein
MTCRRALPIKPQQWAEKDPLKETTMKLFTRSTKIAGSLAAALMVSAPLAFAATPSFAADYHSSDRHDGDKGRNDNYRSDNGRGDNYRGGDRDDHGMHHEKIVFRIHDKRFGHWGYAHGHRMWIVAFHAR